MDTAHLARSLRHHRQLDHREGRRVRGQDPLGLDDLLEFGEQRSLYFEIFDDALDDEIAVGELSEMVGYRDTAENRLAFLFGHAFLGDLACEPGTHLCQNGISAGLDA